MHLAPSAVKRWDLVTNLAANLNSWRKTLVREVVWFQTLFFNNFKPTSRSLLFLLLLFYFSYLSCYVLWVQTVVCLGRISSQHEQVWANSSITAAALSRDRRSTPLSDQEENDLRRRITADVVRLADQGAREVLARKTQDDRFFFNLGMFN